MRWRFGSSGLLGAAILAISLAAVAPAHAACPADTYQQGSECKACPPGAKSPAGSLSPIDCTCPRDTFNKGPDSLCVSCPAGTYHRPASVVTKDSVVPCEKIVCLGRGQWIVDENLECKACKKGAKASADKRSCFYSAAPDTIKGPLNLKKSTKTRCAPGTHARGASCVPNRIIMPKIVPRQSTPGGGAAPSRTNPPAGLMRVR